MVGEQTVHNLGRAAAAVEDVAHQMQVVDGEALDEPYTLEPTHRRIDFGDSVTVPEGCLFVMGDNRNGSTDSRDDRIGCVDERLVIGRAFFLLVPGGDPQHGESRDWSRIGVIS